MLRTLRPTMTFLRAIRIVNFAIYLCCHNRGNVLSLRVHTATTHAAPFPSRFRDRQPVGHRQPAPPHTVSLVGIAQAADNQPKRRRPDPLLYPSVSNARHLTASHRSSEGCYQRYSVWSPRRHHDSEITLYFFDQRYSWIVLISIFYGHANRVRLWTRRLNRPSAPGLSSICRRLLLYISGC